VNLTHTNRQGHVERTTPDGIYGFFLAEFEFQTPSVIGTISFGDRELYINTEVSPYGRPHRYALWEWADACGRSDLLVRDARAADSFSTANSRWTGTKGALDIRVPSVVVGGLQLPPLGRCSAFGR